MGVRLISTYADQRVGPHGVMRLEERFAEAKRRYKGVAYASVNDPRYEELVANAYEIERQIGEKTKVRLNEIDDALIAPIISKLASYKLAKD